MLKQAKPLCDIWDGKYSGRSFARLFATDTSKLWSARSVQTIFALFVLRIHGNSITIVAI